MAEDFETRYGGVRGFLQHYGSALADTAAEENLLAGGDFRIRYTDYDWSLNDVGNCGTP